MNRLSPRRLRNLRPSASVVISVLALIVTVGSGSFAVASSMVRTETKVAQRVVKKLAPTLTVAHAGSADSATNADNAAKATSASKAANADHATTADRSTVATSATKASDADHATNADNATSATTATTATDAPTAANALELGGIDAADYTQRGCGPLTGQIKGFVQVPITFPRTNNFTSNGLIAPYNCSGQAVEVAHPNEGDYRIRFRGNQAQLSFMTLNAGGPFMIEHRMLAPGEFEVVWGPTQLRNGEAGFTVLIP